MKLITILAFYLSLLIGSTNIAYQSHLLTVASILDTSTEPSHSASATELESAKRDSESVKKIRKLVQAILQGNIRRIHDLCSPVECCTRQKVPGRFIDPQKISGFIFDKIQTEAQKIVAEKVPAQYMGIAKGFLDAWRSTREMITSRRKIECKEDRYIIKSPLLQVAHQIALDKIIKLLIILYAPKAHPCDRMHALFLLNHMHLLGRQGTVFKHFIARSNRHYFTKEGIIKCYDPSAHNNENPKRIKELVRFLRTVCTTEKQYLDYLRLSIRHGITECICYTDQNVHISPRKNRSILTYSTAIIKHITGYNIDQWRTVDQSIICSKTVNQDFLTMMEYCCVEVNDPERQLYLDQARALIHKHKNVDHAYSTSYAMRTYYNDALKRSRS